MKAESPDHREEDTGHSILNADGFELAQKLLEAGPEAAAFADFGPYRIEKHIGRGGMGDVYLAKDERAERSVAIKFLLRPWGEQDFRENFTREIRTLAKLEHPFIARLYDAGLHPDGTPYFVMEYVDGRPVNEYCREHGYTVEQRLRLFRLVCEAVQFAHSRLVLHRDLKPSNILVKEEGTPKLLDFGIAKQLEGADEAASQTQTQLRFTPAFAAPEQLRGEPVGLYTDVYALGIILYELLAGTLPFNLKDCTRAEAESIIASEKEAEKPSVAAGRLGTQAKGSGPDKAAWADLDVLCLKAIRKDIARRYSSVGALIEDTDHYLRGEPLRARPDTLRYRTRKFVVRNRRAVLGATLILLLIAGLTATFTIRLARSRNTALAEAARTERIQQFMLNMFDNKDAQAGPANDLRVVTLLDRGAQQAGSLGSDPETQAEVYETLGRLYQQMGRLQQADELLRLGVEKSKAALGPDNSKTAAALVQLGLLRGDQAQVKAAEQLIREGLAMAKRHLPADDSRVTDAQSSLGRVLAQAGNNKEAIDILEPIVRSPPPGEAGTVILLESVTALAVAEQNSLHFERAEAYHRRALELDRRVLGDAHPRVATDLANLASIALTQGRYAEAERLYRKAEAGFRAWYGADNPTTVQVRSFIARTLVVEGKDAEALALLRETLPAQERTYGTKHPTVAMTLDSLGRLEKKRGELRAAEADFGRAFSIDEAMLGLANLQTALTGTGLAETLSAEKQYTRAEQILRQILQARPASSSPHDLMAAVIQQVLGRVLVAEHRYIEAEKYLAAAYPILKTTQAANVVRRVEYARQDLVTVYEALRQPEKAAAVRGEMAASGPVSK